jgi:hypothetical protein
MRIIYLDVLENIISPELEKKRSLPTEWCKPPFKLSSKILGVVRWDIIALLHSLIAPWI